MLGASLTTSTPAADAASLDKQSIADAYAYSLGRALVIRQEHTDLNEPGVAYNVKCNPLGSADFANPNLDVAYVTSVGTLLPPSATPTGTSRCWNGRPAGKARASA